jgi:hypothetical protein
VKTILRLSTAQNDRFGTHLLEMESRSPYQRQSAARTARCILSSDFCRPSCAWWNPFILNDPPGTRTTLSEMEGRHFPSCAATLTVLANCLLTLKESGELEQSTRSLEKSYSLRILGPLACLEIGQNQHKTLILAVRCLQCLVRSSSEL